MPTKYLLRSEEGRPRSSYIPELDGIRAFATLMVICFHFWQSFATGPYNLIGKVAVWGQTGVDLFFVLSGFLITGILLDSLGTAHFLRNFYARRFLRIFPLYYAALAAIYIVAPILRLTPWVGISKSFWFWLYLQNIPLTFSPSGVMGPNHFWSLAVEEQFYLAWPLIVVIASRKTLLRILAMAVVISVFTRVALGHYASFYFTLARLDGLAIGSGAAILRDRRKGPFLADFARYVLLIIGPSLVVAQLVMSGRHNFIIQIVKSTLVSFVYAGVLILVITKSAGRAVERVLSASVMRSIGRYSYGMYVIHPFLLGWLKSLGLPYNLFGLFTVIAATWLLAMMCWQTFEKRFLHLKRRFDYRNAPLQPATSSPTVMALAPKPVGCNEFSATLKEV